MLTRRDIIVKWSAYGAVSLGLVLLHALLLRDVELLGVRMFLPPLLVAVVASAEDARAGAIYGLVCGLLCDLTIAGTFPCLYTAAFTLAAPACSFLAQSVLQPGVTCSLAATALTFLFVDALNMLALFLRARAPFAAMADLALRELAVSCLPLAAVHPALLYLRRRFLV